MRAIIFLSILIAIAVFAGCHRNKCTEVGTKHYLSPKYKINYQTGQMLVFKSNNNEFDTFRIRRAYCSLNPNPESYGGDCKDVHDEFEDCHVLIERDSDKVLCGYFETLFQSYSINHEVLSATWHPLIQNSTSFNISTTIPELSIQGQTYMNVYCFLSNEDTISQPEIITMLYIAAPTGLIRYKQHNNVIWDLVSAK